MSAKKLKKLALLLSTVLLVFLLFLTGTHASQSYRELKTSSLARPRIKNEVEIIDEFSIKTWDSKTFEDGPVARTLKIKNVGDNPVFIRAKGHDQFKIKDLNDNQHNDKHYINENLLLSKKIEIDSEEMIISESSYNNLPFKQRLENKVWVKIGDYCYYSVPIFPISSNQNFDSETTSLLNAIRLKPNPSYALIYYTELEVETIECDEFELQHVWSEDISNQLFNSYMQQIKAIKNASAYNAGSEGVK